MNNQCASCSKPLPELAEKTADLFCSRKCCELHHGLTMAADLKHGGGPTAAEVTKMRSLDGAAAPTTRLMREAAARDLEARARVGREDRAGRYSHLEAGQ